MDHNLFDMPEGMDNVSNEMVEQMQVLDQQILTCFSTRAGKKVMQHLKDLAGQPGFDAGLGLFNGIANGFAREGQVALVQYLQKRMIRAERGKYE